MSSLRRNALLGKLTQIPATGGGSATVAFGNVNTITITPTGGPPDEGLVILVTIDAVASITITSAPSGFSRVVPGFSPSRCKEIYWKIATSSEPASYVFNFSGNATGGMYKFNSYKNLELVNGAPHVIADLIGTGGAGTTVPLVDVAYDVRYPCLAVAMGVVSSGASTSITITNNFQPGPASHAGSAKIWTRIYDNVVALAESPTVNTQTLTMSFRTVIFLGKRI